MSGGEHDLVYVRADVEPMLLRCSCGQSAWLADHEIPDDADVGLMHSIAVRKLAAAHPKYRELRDAAFDQMRREQR